MGSRLEILINTSAVQMRLKREDAAEDFASGRFDLDVEDLPFYQPDVYGDVLRKALLTDEKVRMLWSRALDPDDAPLRIAVRARGAAAELNWELLREGDSFCSCADRTTLARMPADGIGTAERDWRELRSVVAISAPNDAPDVAEVKHDDEFQRIRHALGVFRPRRLSPNFTLTELREALEDGVDVLYLVCHGKKNSRDGSKLLLHRGGKSQWLDGEDLVSMIDGLKQKPLLMVLASCESAKLDGGASLAAKLVRAGVPAVVAMDGQINMKTVEIAMPKLFRELSEHGDVETAVNRARGAARDEGFDDFWMPQLYHRLVDGVLWDPEILPPPISVDPQEVIAGRHGAGGGTVRIDSKFYVEREADRRMRAAIEHERAATLVIMGMRQSGKSSLLARTIALARERGERTFYLDFQELDGEHFESLGRLMKVIAFFIHRAFKTEIKPDDVWDDDMLGAKQSFADFLEVAVLEASDEPVLLALDEVDRVFDRDYRDDFFSAVRTWHNRRATREPWERLSLAITHATDPALWISDINQSPFNVGEPLRLRPFDREQIADLASRYGLRLGAEDLETLESFLGGQPFLICRAFWTMTSRGVGLRELVKDIEPFSDILRRHEALLRKDDALCKIVRGLALEDGCADEMDFQRLRAAGLVAGTSRKDARLSCELYREYFRERL